MKFELDPRLKPYGVPLGLGAALIVLIIVILVEWFAFRHSLAQNNKAPRAPNPDTLGAAVSLEGLGLPSVGEFSETVERPLFMESRRPSPPPPPGAAKRAEPPAPVTFQLMGVVESPRGRVALIAESKGKYRKLREKDSIDGWEIVRITNDRILLHNEDIEESLNLVKKRPKTAGQQQHQEPPPQNQDRSQTDAAAQQSQMQQQQMQMQQQQMQQQQMQMQMQQQQERDPNAPPIGWPQAEEAVDENQNQN